MHLLISPPNWEGEMITTCYKDEQAELDLKNQSLFHAAKGQFSHKDQIHQVLCPAEHHLVQGYLPVYTAGCETVPSGLCFSIFLYTSSLFVSFLFFIFLPSPPYMFLLRAHPAFLISESLPQVLHLGNLI